MKVHKKLNKITNVLFVGALVSLGLFFGLTWLLAIYDWQLTNKIFPGIKIDNIDVSMKTKSQVITIFASKNKNFENAKFTFQWNEKNATVSGKQLNLGYNSKLIADQAYTLGRSSNLIIDMSNKIRALFGELNLPPSFSIDTTTLEKTLAPIAKDVTIEAVDGIFEIKGDKVTAFRQSREGQTIDLAALEQEILQSIPKILENPNTQFTIAVEIKKTRPVNSLEAINGFGIKEKVGEGKSTFVGSISNRIHNIALAASRIDGTIVKAGEVFSFNDTVGDVSKLTGYKEAYIIKDGKTILGDGGGVCQVSTTLFRAMLASGLPVVERHPHSYRVSYYEQDSSPGFDATVYAPSYDLRFKNDTASAILIEAFADTANATLTFELYGTLDTREVALSKPIITKQVPAPPDLYQDDPTLPAGAVKQIDFKAAGATVEFLRTVKKDGETLFSDTFTSNYRPWQAVFLRGTKEN